MGQNTTSAQARREYRLEHTIGRVFLTAHLMTANIEQAERAVCEAIDSFDPDRVTEEDLLRDAIRAVVRGVAGQTYPLFSNHRNWNGWALPDELQAVLNLSPDIRQCYVLRILAGLSQHAGSYAISVQA